MRFIMTFVWAILISGTISYVLTSMAGQPFSVLQTLILSGIIGIIVIALGEFALKEE